MMMTVNHYCFNDASNVFIPGVANCLPRPWRRLVSGRCGPAAGGRCSAPVPGSSEATPESFRAVLPGRRRSVPPGLGHGCSG